MILKVLIVDDKPLFARKLKKIVEGFASAFDNIFYSAIVIEGNNAYTNAKEYILSNQAEIDILLADYNLDDHLKGTDLFKFIDRKHYCIYTVLHSITTISRHIAERESNISFDSFCSSKDDKEIAEELRKYEETILKFRLRGNIKFQNIYFVNELRLDPKASEPFFDTIGLFDILYAQTDGKGYDLTTAYYRDQSDNKIKKTREKRISIKKFLDSGLCFRRVNGSMVINLLWVAKIDISKKIIRFITLDNSIFEISYIPTDCFQSEIIPLLGDIDNVPSFFKH